jgi:hypothetical protein
MTLATLIRRARRRLLGNELLSQGANASSAALAAFILLLLLGTEILRWQWALLIPLAAAAVGLYRVRQRMPSSYSVAQIVDHRMALADSISTALFFSEVAPDADVSPEIRRSQFEIAGQIAESVDVRKAIPYTMPRSLYLLGALLLVASSLFALRYGLSRRLDLQQPLASMLQQSLGNGEKTEQARNQRRDPKRIPETPDDGAASVPDQEQNGQDQQDMAPETTDTSGEMDSPKSPAAPSQGKKQADEGDQMAAGDDPDSPGDKNSGADGDENNSGKPNDGKSDQAKNQQDSKQDGSNPGENSSILSKVKDAMQNLLSRMKPQQSNPGQQQSMEQNSKQAKGQQNGGKQQSKDGQQQNGQQGDAQEGQSGDDAKNAENAQGKGTGKSESQQASKQPGSGIGSQDGDKNIKSAEQLAAMGKLSEILGKRSANISGEATIEVQTTSQQLHTPYAQRGIQHTQGGAEINRDEVPVALQTYVEQYFEQVRKQTKK